MNKLKDEFLSTIYPIGKEPNIPAAGESYSIDDFPPGTQVKHHYDINSYGIVIDNRMTAKLRTTQNANGDFYDESVPFIKVLWSSYKNPFDGYVHRMNTTAIAQWTFPVQKMNGPTALTFYIDEVSAGKKP